MPDKNRWYRNGEHGAPEQRLSIDLDKAIPLDEFKTTNHELESVPFVQNEDCKDCCEKCTPDCQFSNFPVLEQGQCCTAPDGKLYAYIKDDADYNFPGINNVRFLDVISTP